MPFDPDAYLAQKSAFDPDAYLSGNAGGVSQQPVAVAPQPTEDQSYESTILPFSRSAEGETSFDPNVGVMGMVKRAFTAPGEVMRGELDPQSEEGMRRATEFAGALTPMGAAGRVSGSVFSPKRAYKTVTPPVPTREELKAATTAGYGEARAMGAEYAPTPMKEWAEGTINQLNTEGRIASNYPKVHRLLEEISTPPEGAKSITLESVDALYKELGHLGGDPAEGTVASIAQRSLDDFHAALDPSSLVAGTATPQRAAEVLREARGNAAAGFRSDRVTGLEKTAARRTAAANSGRNTDNAIRQRLTSLIESTKGSRGLSKQEEDAIDNIIFGSKPKNLARNVGNLLGGGGGLGTSMLAAGGAAGGAATMGPMGAALGLLPPAIGAGSRTLANRMTAKELKALDEMMRARSPANVARGGPQQVYAPQAIPETMLKALAFQSMQGPQVPFSQMQNALGAR